MRNHHRQAQARWWHNPEVLPQNFHKLPVPVLVLLSLPSLANWLVEVHRES